MNWMSPIVKRGLGFLSQSFDNKFNTKIHCLTALIVLGHINGANAVLSISTLERIHGHYPAIAINDELVDSSGFSDKLTVVSMPDGKLRDRQSDILDFKVDPSTTYNDIKWVLPAKQDSNEDNKIIIEANGQEVKLSDIAANLGVGIFDEDGDVGVPQGVLSATWYYSFPGGKGKGEAQYKPVPESELNSKMEPCRAPYKLVLSIKNIKAQTEYGLPSESEIDYADVIQEYVFKSKINKICYARTNPMMNSNRWSWTQYNGDEPYGYGWNSRNISSTPDPKHGGGYLKSEWDPELGFLLEDNYNNRFPRTIFKGATFQLWMSNDQQDYLWSTDDENISIDELGIVTFNAKPKRAAFQIFAWPKDAKGLEDRVLFWSAFDFWAKYVRQTNEYSEDLCGGIQNQLTIADWNNTPQALDPATDNNVMATNVTMTRKTYGGLNSEWGQLIKEYYPNSDFPTSGFVNGTEQRHAWVSDTNGNGSIHNVVTMLNGGVNKVQGTQWTAVPFAMVYEVCKERW
ncbi:hypothetical protein J3U44_02940 [Gilliamella sp. B3766]|nr:hypothetical protein [Gilliamella sp. B3722]MCX8609047.1 hypothetical protein [Gilliamella sp. B3771]MCX8610048.1 hypothetical protein [Gilliamella sp. B3891]MCX8612692.1 hypothetical protein [Gilliamella sp. B3773]MCX8616661.1 hypothetical protein [Gilliamella sp. B3770]MCX8619755.1 hypothetical protein [Gilliamella sp. B3892]MCX8622388.1 hypothetical protein [Gilliamella sp. B3759]MCX8624628.1 hypothetical protein [Gilliamella sp. B3766]MCX8626549.1 hypothetical protein [Gilliamella sp